MKIFTVHAPKNNRDVDASREVFVRDGFHVWAFLLAPLWMIWHRLWLVLVGYIAIIAMIELGLAMLGIDALAGSWISLLFGFLVGLEASSLQRWTLARRGWRPVATVAARNLNEAERRFYSGAAHATSHAAAMPKAATERNTFAAPQAIIGLFPQPQNPGDAK